MTWLRVFAVALCVTTSILARSAWAEPPPDADTQAAESERAAAARTHFARGSELYTAGDLPGTLIEFERAYELRPSPLLRFHIGRVALELRRFARSYLAFSQYLATETVDPMNAEKRTEAESMLRDLAPRIAQLTIDTNVPGAHISIDEQPIGEAPLAEPVVLDVGTYRVHASKPGFAALTRVISLAGGDHQTVRLELQSLEPPPPTVTVAPAAPAPTAREENAPPRPLMTRGLWAGFAFAGAMAIAGSVSGIYALKASSNLDRDLFVGASARQDFADDSDRVRALSITADVLLGTAFVSAQTSVVLLLLRARRHARSGIRMRGALHPRGLVLEGAF